MRDKSPPALKPGTLPRGLIVSLGLLIAACSPAGDDPTPRLLTSPELRAGIEAARNSTPPAAGTGIEARGAALRGRAGVLRGQPAVAEAEQDDLRARARARANPAP